MAGIPLDKAELIALFLETFLYGESLFESTQFYIHRNDTSRYFLYLVLDHSLDTLEKSNREKTQPLFDYRISFHVNLVNRRKSR